MLRFYDEVIYLPPDLAVTFAACQNFEADVRKKVVSGYDQWDFYMENYLKEAGELLREDKQNFFPEFEDHPHIRIASSGMIDYVSDRAKNLLTLFRKFYKNYGRKAAVRPDPKLLITNGRIETQLCAMIRNLDFH